MNNALLATKNQKPMVVLNLPYIMMPGTQKQVGISRRTLDS